MRKISVTEIEKANERRVLLEIEENMYVGKFQEYGKSQLAEPVFAKLQDHYGFTEKEVLDWYGEVPQYFEYDCRCHTGFERGVFGLYRHNGGSNKGPAFYVIRTLEKLVGIRLKEGVELDEYITELNRLEEIYKKWNS